MGCVGNEQGELTTKLVTDEPVEVQDFAKTTDFLWGIIRIHLKLIKEKPKDHHNM